LGKKDIEDALKRLDRLTQEEARMAAAQILNLTHVVNNKVREVGTKLKDVDDKIDVVIRGRPGLLATHSPNIDCARWKGRKGGSR
jgi:ABC-type transporter Mla subunit MlaD